MPEIDPEHLSFAFFLLRYTNFVWFRGFIRTRSIARGELSYVHFLLDIYCWRSLTPSRVRSVGQFDLVGVFIVRTNSAVSVVN